MPPSSPVRVLSGIQPSGTKHLGNYFGAIRQYLELQDEFPGQCYFFIADYHALTTLRDPAALRASVFDLARTYLALGLDPDRALLFRQSDVPEVTELTWLLSTVTNTGLLERAHAFKDKTQKGISASVGLFTYPILMASDILVYDATLVPVGADQVQHIEMAQDMAGFFNRAFGADDPPALVRPEPRVTGKGAKVPGLDGQKMSTSYGNTIPLFETGKKLRKLVGRIVTDSTPLGEPLNPDGCTVLALLELFFENERMKEVIGYYETGHRDGEPFGYGHAKLLLAEAIETHFAAARERMAHYESHPEEVEAVLEHCGREARKTARATIDRCRRVCGIA
ncbi:MAG: tryptophan--tRNA ligase [Myxococcota bacterium]